MLAVGALRLKDRAITHSGRVFDPATYDALHVRFLSPGAITRNYIELLRNTRRERERAIVSQREGARDCTPKKDRRFIGDARYCFSSPLRQTKFARAEVQSSVT